LTDRLWAKVESLDREAFCDLINQCGCLYTWRFIEKNIFVIGE